MMNPSDRHKSKDEREVRYEAVSYRWSRVDRKSYLRGAFK